MKNSIIAILLLLIIVATTFNKGLFSPLRDAALTKEPEESSGQLTDKAKNVAAINRQLATLGDRVARLEHAKIVSQQQLQANNTQIKPISASVANGSAQEAVADREMTLLAQATGVTISELATMNGSEIEALNEKQALEQDKQYFKQLEQHFYSGKQAAFDKAFEQSLTDSVNLEELTNSKVSTISCDNAMCRVEVKHSDLNAMTKFLDKVPGLSLWNTEAIVDFPEGQDKPTSVIYLSRKDHRLPVRTLQAR